MLIERVKETMRRRARRGEDNTELAEWLSDSLGGVDPDPARIARLLVMDSPDQDATFVSAGSIDGYLVSVGLSYAFHNKSLRENFDKRAFGNSFKAYAVSPYYLVRHIRAGNAWTPGAFAGASRTKATFESSQLLALDLDDNIHPDDVIAHPFVSEFAFFVHHSPSSTPEHWKMRALFLLAAPTADMQAWERYQSALIEHCYALRPDPACKDAARLFYGAAITGSALPVGSLNPDAVLPTSAIERIAQSHVRRDVAPPKIINFDPQPIGDRYIERAIENEARALATTPEGQRHNQLKRSASALISLSKSQSGIFPLGAAERELFRAAQGAGLPEREIKGVIEWALANVQARG